MKRLLQESEEKLRRMADKIYENNKILENIRARQNIRYYENYMPHQADINKYMNKINNHHNDFIPNQTNYNTNIDRNDFYRSIHDQEMVSDRLLKKFKRTSKKNSIALAFLMTTASTTFWLKNGQEKM